MGFSGVLPRKWSSGLESTSSARDMDSIPDGGIKIPHVMGQLSSCTVAGAPQLERSLWATTAK